MSNEQNPQDVKEFVRDRYAGIAVKNHESSASSGGCCGPTTRDVNDALAGKLGYDCLLYTSPSPRDPILVFPVETPRLRRR